MVHYGVHSNLPSRSFVKKNKRQIVVEKESKKDMITSSHKLSAKFPKVSKRKTTE